MFYNISDDDEINKSLLAINLKISSDEAKKANENKKILLTVIEGSPRGRDLKNKLKRRIDISTTIFAVHNTIQKKEIALTRLLSPCDHEAYLKSYQHPKAISDSIKKYQAELAENYQALAELHAQLSKQYSPRIDADKDAKVKIDFNQAKLLQSSAERNNRFETAKKSSDVFYRLALQGSRFELYDGGIQISALKESLHSIQYAINAADNDKNKYKSLVRAVEICEQIAIFYRDSSIKDKATSIEYFNKFKEYLSQAKNFSEYQQKNKVLSEIEKSLALIQEFKIKHLQLSEPTATEQYEYFKTLAKQSKAIANLYHSITDKNNALQFESKATGYADIAKAYNDAVIELNTDVPLLKATEVHYTEQDLSRFERYKNSVNAFMRSGIKDDDYAPLLTAINKSIVDIPALISAIFKLCYAANKAHNNHDPQAVIPNYFNTLCEVLSKQKMEVLDALKLALQSKQLVLFSDLNSAIENNADSNGLEYELDASKKALQDSASNINQLLERTAQAVARIRKNKGLTDEAYALIDGKRKVALTSENIDYFSDFLDTHERLQTHQLQTRELNQPIQNNIAKIHSLVTNKKLINEKFRDQLLALNLEAFNACKTTRETSLDALERFKNNITQFFNSQYSSSFTAFYKQLCTVTPSINAWTLQALECADNTKLSLTPQELLTARDSVSAWKVFLKATTHHVKKYNEYIDGMVERYKKRGVDIKTIEQAKNKKLDESYLERVTQTSLPKTPKKLKSSLSRIGTADLPKTSIDTLSIELDF